MKLILLLAYLLGINVIAHDAGLDRKVDHYGPLTGNNTPRIAPQSIKPTDKSVSIQITDQEGGSCNALLPLGRPNAADTLLCRTGYVIGFDCEKRSALWVAYEVTPAIHNSANVARSNDFRADRELPENCRKELTDFSGTYDRGHLVSSASLDANHKMNSDTFLLSNMSPQLPNFNRTIWTALEKRERKWSNLRGKVYVFAGPIFNGEKKHGRIRIPSHFYKIIIDPAKGESISFLLPHRPLYSDHLKSYRTSIDIIEAISGVDFLTHLEDDLEDALEERVSGMW